MTKQELIQNYQDHKDQVLEDFISTCDLSNPEFLLAPYFESGEVNGVVDGLVEDYLMEHEFYLFNDVQLANFKYFITKEVIKLKTLENKTGKLIIKNGTYLLEVEDQYPDQNRIPNFLDHKEFKNTKDGEVNIFTVGRVIEPAYDKVLELNPGIELDFDDFVQVLAIIFDVKALEDCLYFEAVK